jgi:hypothetical protein
MVAGDALSHKAGSRSLVARGAGRKAV